MHDVRPEVVWAVRLPCADITGVAALRHIAGVEVCEQAPVVWLRGVQPSEGVENALRGLPGAERFSILADGQLRPAGKRVPHGRLPDANWTPLEKWVALEPQPAALGAELSNRLKLSLTRSCEAREASVLVTDESCWFDYAVAAPEVRLRPLLFALASDKRLLVRGIPVPPLPGERYVENDGVAVPCGYAVYPRLEPAVLHEILELSRGDLALFSPDGSFERIVAMNFVPATRSAVRLTREAIER